MDENPIKLTPEETLLSYQAKLKELKALKAHVEARLNAIGVGGRDYNEWCCSCENRALNDIVRSIKGDLNLPVTTDKLTRITEQNGHQHANNYGRWLENMKPEYLTVWIEKNIGNPVAREIQHTVDEMFPTYLRDPDSIFDDKKNTISRTISSFEPKFLSDQYELSYRFDPGNCMAFLKLCQAIGTNTPYENADVPLPPILNRENTWTGSELFRWHAVPQSDGVTRIRVLKDGTWRFELSGPAYVRMKEMGQKNFAKKKDNL